MAIPNTPRRSSARGNRLDRFRSAAVPQGGSMRGVPCGASHADRIAFPIIAPLPTRYCNKKCYIFHGSRKYVTCGRRAGNKCLHVHIVLDMFTSVETRTKERETHELGHRYQLSKRRAVARGCGAVGHRRAGPGRLRPDAATACPRSGAALPPLEKMPRLAWKSRPRVTTGPFTD